MPRDRNLWLFGEAHGFNNNSKYLFLEVLKTEPNVQAYWIGNRVTAQYLKENGLPAYSRLSFKGLFLCLRAGVYIVSWTPADINFYLSGGAKVVNLWHGIGWKKCLWLNPYHAKYKEKDLFQRFLHRLDYPHLYYPPSFVLSSSPLYSKVFSKAFDVPISNCIEAIYPRCKFMLKPHEEIITHLKTFHLEEEMNLIERIKNHQKTILYAPTFRDNKEDFLSRSGIDFSLLNKECDKHNCLFIIKLHPSTTLDLTSLQSYSNILLMSNKTDLYYIMPFTDILISDYSSIAIDYMLLKKKILLFLFDYKEYQLYCRDLLFSLNDAIEGIPAVYSAKDLIDTMFLDLQDFAYVSEEKYWGASDELISAIKENTKK